MAITIHVERTRSKDALLSVVYESTYTLRMSSTDRDRLLEYGFGPLRAVLREIFTPPLPNASPPTEEELSVRLKELSQTNGPGLTIVRDTYTAFGKIDQMFSEAVLVLPGYWDGAAGWETSGDRDITASVGI